MTIQRTPKNIAKDAARRVLSKHQPRPPKPPKEFTDKVKRIMDARAAKYSGGLCELDGCGQIEVYHHRRPRGSGGSSLAWVNQAANGLALSDHCHLRVEGRLEDSSRITSHVKGWLVSMHGTTMSADVPVLYRGQYVLLRDDGCVKPLTGDSWDESEVLS